MLIDFSAFHSVDFRSSEAPYEHLSPSHFHIQAETKQMCLQDTPETLVFNSTFLGKDNIDKL